LLFDYSYDIEHESATKKKTKKFSAYSGCDVFLYWYTFLNLPENLYALAMHQNLVL